ncbi:glycine--tRNA ligase subunit beta [Thermodesulfobacteriota bacterium]
MDSLLLEIGTEEIPAGYIEPALKVLSQKILQKLIAARIECGDVNIFGTPRRLSVIVERVKDKQDPLEIEVLGPPEKIGIDSEGKPTVAGLKFAEKIGIPVEQLFVKATEKGSYLCAVQTERGRKTRTLLQDIVPETIREIPFPKTMKWADQELKFARPIHSILCLFGKQVVSFSFGHIKSGRYSFGHRFNHSGRIKIVSADDYIEVLKRAHVIADISERKALIEKAIAKAADSLGGEVLSDSELVDVVSNLVEYPVAVAGKFDQKFLNLPQEILITAMREHQKYFAVVDKDRKLLPGFIAVNNTAAKKMSLVAKGHERVLRARLEDARFFYQSDLQMATDDSVEKLKGVLFQASLGSMHEKTLRVRRLAENIVDSLEKLDDVDRRYPEVKMIASRAAFLCKADLVSQVVGEFPKLQGVMGRVYALAAGESEEAALAIEEHYRPTYSGGALPESIPGAIVSIADKMDSICGCFSAGLVPTGASDPYALRRQGIGIIQIMLDKRFSFSLRQTVKNSLSLFDTTDKDSVEKTAGEVIAFIQKRIANLLSDDGFSKDIVTAIVSISVDHVPNVWNRVRALQTLKEKPDFEPLTVTFKRVVNIIKQAKQKGILEKDVKVDSSLFQEDCEVSLFNAYQNIEQNVSTKLDRGLVEEALLDVAMLRGPVDIFFDGVLVMTDDLTLRRNRLSLLGDIAALFDRFADFSKIST